MFNTDQAIPCPICSTKIPFDARQLLLGMQFVCPTCQSAIGLSMESKPIVEDAIQKLDKMKSSLPKSK